MTYPESLEYLDSFVNFERKNDFEYPKSLKLDRMHSLLKELGQPHRAYDCVLIAGSKGKGSIAAMLSSILRMEDYRVGLYTSPHLIGIRERIRVNGLLISEQRFTDLVLEIRRVLDTYTWRKDPPTYFEVLTAMAFKFFKDSKVQWAVLEVGLGGMYDSTNVAHAKAAGIGPIGLEHTDKLGKTVSKIAVQKCGIIKGRETVVSAPQQPDAMRVIEKAVESHDGALLRVGREIQITERRHDEKGQWFDLRTPDGDFHDLMIPLLGRHQIDNAAVAVGLAKAIEHKTRFKVHANSIRRGLMDVRWPGRMEKISDKPAVMLDGAHTVESMKQAVETLERHCHYDKLILIAGVSSDKNHAGMMEIWRGKASMAYATQSRHERATPASRLAESMDQAGLPACAVADCLEAYQRAVKEAGENDLVFVTGSLYLIGELKERLGHVY